MFKLSLLEMKIFLTVANYKNFSRAAETLYIAQPTVTKWIKNLENELEVQLFERTSKTVTLTAAGEFLYDKWSLLYKDLELSILDARVISNNAPISLHIGALFGYEYEDFLLEFLNPYEQLHPNIHFDCNIYGLREFNEQIDNFDILLTINLETKNLKNFTYIRLDDVPLFLAVSKKHNFAKRKSISLSEIGQENQLIFSPELSVSAIDYASKAYDYFGIKPQFTYVKNVPSQLMKIAQNKGVCITGRPIITGYEREISLIRIKDFPLEMYRVLAYKPKKLSHTGIDFCNYIADHFTKKIN